MDEITSGMMPPTSRADSDSTSPNATADAVPPAETCPEMTLTPLFSLETDHSTIANAPTTAKCAADKMTPNAIDSATPTTETETTSMPKTARLASDPTPPNATADAVPPAETCPEMTLTPLFSLETDHSTIANAPTTAKRAADKMTPNAIDSATPTTETTSMPKTARLASDPTPPNATADAVPPIETCPEMTLTPLFSLETDHSTIANAPTTAKRAADKRTSDPTSLIIMTTNAPLIAVARPETTLTPLLSLVATHSTTSAAPALMLRVTAPSA
jgi:hypothetical protein